MKRTDLAIMISGAIPVAVWLLSRSPVLDAVSQIAAWLPLAGGIAFGIRALVLRRRIWPWVGMALLGVASVLFIRQAVVTERELMKVRFAEVDCSTIQQIYSTGKALGRSWHSTWGTQLEGLPDSRTESVVLYLHNNPDGFIIQADHLHENLMIGMKCANIDHQGHK